MEEDKRKQSHEIALIGESWVIYKLATMKLRCQKLFDFIDYDLLVENGMRIEVKTSRPIIHRDHRRKGYERKIWAFTNIKNRLISNKGIKRMTWKPRDRKCDFFVFVCLNDDREVIKSFVVPKKVIKKRKGITIPCEIKHKVESSLKDYEEKWDLIII